MEMEIHPSIFKQKVQHLVTSLRDDHLHFDWTALLNVAAEFTKALDDHNLQLEIEEAAAEQDTSKGLHPKKKSHFTAGCTNNDTQHTQAHDDVSLMLATFDTPTYLPNRCH